MDKTTIQLWKHFFRFWQRSFWWDTTVFLACDRTIPQAKTRDREMIDSAASELLKNEAMHVGLWNSAREEILFTDSPRGSIGVLNTKSGNIKICSKT